MQLIDNDDNEGIEKDDGMGDLGEDMGDSDGSDDEQLGQTGGAANMEQRTVRI